MTLPVADPGDERGRICAALLRLVGERGYPAVTLPDLERIAGVGESSFHRHFLDLDSCFAAIWDAVDRELVGRQAAAYQAAPDWPAGIRAALEATLSFLAAEPAAARLYVSESVFAGGQMPARRQQAMAHLAELIDKAPGGPGKREGGPRAIAEGVAGGIWQRLNLLIREGDAEGLAAEVPQLAYFCVLPFLGRDAAEEQLREGERG